VSVWLRTFASVALVSAVPLIGMAALALGEERWRRAVPALVSFATGALLGRALLHLLPEAQERLGARSASVWLLAGFLGFFVLEKLIGAHRHARRRPRRREAARPTELAILNLVADGVHNAMDGMAIAAAHAADPALGLATTVAVALHEIPQEVGDLGILVHGGFPVRKAVLLNLLSAAVAFAGATAALAARGLGEGVGPTLLPIAAGTLLYIAAADLVPELRRVRGLLPSLRQILLVLLGLALLAVAGGRR
jgi:zinc and cadmium transporter